ncbi:sulfotransferase family protein [Nocardioides xinjiangensis]|uniref:sulfotransferase family 2 domain-containing protein n=1 Tax=Nocardioides xinjiangensis TaxID=2817376 RepID=UPI001B30C3CE|nr:sulfotransferase family 2 domain-containing protein [Nocardioides sp. SYSU D00514]
MIASHQHRFIFLKTRKTAGTSVEIALSKVCGPDDIITEISPEDEELRRAAGGRPPQNFTSPPLPRKAYNHMGAKATRDLVGADVFADYFTFAIERNPWDAVVSLYFWKYKDRAELPDFESYVREIWIEQLANNRRLYRIRGKMALDRVLRYENLDAELEEVWDHLGLPGRPDLPRAKGNARPAGHYRELYTPASRERVATVFADTIEAFGYEF